MRLRTALISAAAVAAATLAWPAAALAVMVEPYGAGSDQPASTAHAVHSSIRTPIVTKGSWPVYHRDDAHTGSDPSLPALTRVTAGWTSAAVDGQIYAEPLIFGGIVYVATLNNTVYALNQADGSLIWTNHLRAPESHSPGTTGGPQCGNVVPQGILGTPVVDPGTSRIYVVTLSGVDDLYRLEGLRLSDGVEQINTIITTKALTGFDWTIEQQRGALEVANGNVYVPFGGRAGDCGPYHGDIFAVPTNGSASLPPYITPGQGAGFWAAGGIAIDDSTGKVFATSGNGTSSGCDANVDGTPTFENDAVIRLSATLVHEGAFVPVDWQGNWCGNDQDLGSAGPLIISPNLIFQSGKWGTGFLVHPNALGGMDGQAFPTPTGADPTSDVCFGNHSDATFASFAYAAPFVYVECEGRGLVALNVNTSTPSFGICSVSCPLPDWHVGSGITFGPPIVAAGAVWVATDGGGLYAYRANNGAQIYHSAGFGINRFVTPAEAGGQVFVPSHTVVREFNMVFGNAQSVPGTPPSRPVPVVQAGAPPPPSRQPVSQSTPTPPPAR